MGVRILNYLFSLPSDDTSAFLRDLLQASPIEIDFIGLAVCLGTSNIEIPLQDKPLRAVAGSLGIWYDPQAGFSRLILPLFPSTEMVVRHAEIGDVWGRHFVPYMVLCDFPSSRRNKKGFINSISTALVDTNQQLVFDTEVVVVAEDIATPPDYEFYKEQMGLGALSNQVLLEEDEGIS